ncbi:MAG: hypothetical protein FWC24_03300 [Treponema sp.]|nr:hypothetical protein [Treponema sp.]
MNIGSVSSHSFPNIYAITVAHGQRMSVPVSPSSYIYSHFKHISGVPASEGEPGVNINKLKIIDTLIEQISKMKKEPEPLVEMNAQNEEKSLNAIINNYHNQVRSIQAANAKNPFAQAAPLVGAIFNISA